VVNNLIENQIFELLIVRVQNLKMNKRKQEHIENRKFLTFRTLIP